MSTARIIRADARQLPVADASADLIVTSPPFWMLRQYTDGGRPVEGQIGLEPRWEQYIETLVDCTREWLRVLKPEGSLWVNLGDKYGRGTRTTVHGGHSKQAYVDGDQPGVCAPTGFEKSLIGLPWRYAFACIDELGLKLRAEVVWHKRNGLPESVRDRVRRSHEYLFHFTKQENYYAAVDEISQGILKPDEIGLRGRLPGSVWEFPNEPLVVPDYLSTVDGEDLDHYAAFPTALVRPIIKGWSPRSVCTACGQGRFPVSVSHPAEVIGHACACTPYTDYPERRGSGWHEHSDEEKTGPVRDYHLDRWTPPSSVPGVVVDPFGGSGTTALVAAMHGRDGISSDLSADYARIATWRLRDGAERARALGEKKTPKEKRLHEHLYGDHFTAVDGLMA